MGLKVYWGCGTDLRPGWINVDLWKPDCVDHTFVRHNEHLWSKNAEGNNAVVWFLQIPTLLEASYFSVGSVDEIYSNHVLEHLDFRSFMSLLWEFRRMLVPGIGTMHHIVPDFDSLTKRWQKLWEPEPTAYATGSTLCCKNHVDTEEYIRIVDGICCAVGFNVPPHQSLWNKSSAEFFLSRWDFRDVTTDVDGDGNLHMRATRSQKNHNSV